MRVGIARRREIAEKVRETMGALGSVELDGVPLEDLIYPYEGPCVDCDPSDWEAMVGRIARRVGASVEGCDGQDAEDRINEALDRRLVPEGYEWPRFEDGEPVRVGDEFVDGLGCIDVARPICLDVNVYSLNPDAGTSSWVGYEERARRPAPDVDGTPLRVGDSVWDAETGAEWVVTRVDGGAAWGAEPDGHECAPLDPSRLSRSRPEADGWEQLERDASRIDGLASCWDYLDRRGLQRGAGETAMGACVRDMIGRARALSGREAGDGEL